MNREKETIVILDWLDPNGIRCQSRWLHFPVGSGAHQEKIMVDGTEIRLTVLTPDREELPLEVSEQK